MKKEQILSIVSPRARGNRIPILMGLRDCELLCQCAEMAPTEGWIVDLGTYAGGSAALLCAVCGDRWVITIDSYGEACAGRPVSEEIARGNLAKAGFSPRFVVGDSRDVPPDIDEVALICLDTLHDEQHITEELNAWSPFLVKGSIVAIHDYGAARFPEVRPAVNRFFMSLEWRYIGRGKSLVAFRRLQ